MEKEDINSFVRRNLGLIFKDNMLNKYNKYPEIEICGLILYWGEWRIIIGTNEDDIAGNLKIVKNLRIKDYKLYKRMKNYAAVNLDKIIITELFKNKVK